MRDPLSAVQMLREDGSWNEAIADDAKDFKKNATIEEQFDGIGKTIDKLTDEITQLYDMFDVSFVFTFLTCHPYVHYAKKLEHEHFPVDATILRTGLSYKASK